MNLRTEKLYTLGMPGENKGKKPWSKLKYFYDLKDIFLNFVSDKRDNKFENIFYRMSNGLINWLIP